MKIPLEDIEFPQYRKYSNNKNYFRILSLTEFIEYQLIGSKIAERKVQAIQYPEKLFIRDLLDATSESIVICSKEEFAALFKDFMS